MAGRSRTGGDGHRPGPEPGLVPPGGAEGLTETEAARRAAAGQANTALGTGGRSLGGIVRENVVTPFNLVLGILLVAILVVGPLQDALFGLILVANTGIGLIQELRAKRTLDRLSIQAKEPVTVIRDGRRRTLPPDAIVLGDLVEIRQGDDIPVDGIVVDSSGLQLNEALLSGEPAPVDKGRGDELLSASFVTAGGGRYRATKVGEESYARRLTLEARRFQPVRSELVRDVNRILTMIGWLLPVLAAAQIVTQFRTNPAIGDAVRASVAGIVTIIPEGLFLLTSVSMAVAVVRLGRRRILAQQLAAVEMLARVDVVCMDKTGTLTDGGVTLERVLPLRGDPETEPALAALAAADPAPDASMRALARLERGAHGWTLERAVPFASERRWSAATFRDRGTWVLGAPDAVLAAGAPSAQPAQVLDLMRQGRRILMLARAAAETTSTRKLTGVVPVAVVVLRETLRPDARTTLAYLTSQGVEIKLLSGDHPSTVAAIAAGLGLIVRGSVDASDLAGEDHALRQRADSTTVFGRVSPAQKRSLVQALRQSGRTVAMVGDGVNDILALKAADVSMAMGAGSPAARRVAHLTLLDSSFSHVPLAVAEGRRVIGNIERLSDLFLTKTVYAILLILAVTVAAVPFPFLPRHLTLVSAFTIGIPAVLLALAPNTARVSPGFLGRVLRFSVPAGLVTGLAAFATYLVAQNSLHMSADQAQTSALLVLGGAGLLVLIDVARPMNALRASLVLAMAAGLALSFALPLSRSVFELTPPAAWGWVVIAVAIALAGIGLSAVRTLWR